MNYQRSVLFKNLFENAVPLNMRLRMQPRSVTVDKMAGIFTKRIWQPYRRAKGETIGKPFLIKFLRNKQMCIQQVKNSGLGTRFKLKSVVL